jgi:hypothetical protein
MPIFVVRIQIIYTMKKVKWLWYASLVILIINLVVIYLLPKEGKLLLIISDLLPVVVSGIAVMCVGLTYRKFVFKDNAKTTWLMILLGTLLYFAAELVYGVMEVVFQKDMNEIFPSLADVLWCLGYIPFLWALFLVIKGFRKSGFPMGNRWVYTTLIVGSFALFVLIAFVLLKPVISDAETSLTEKIFYLFYPIMDLFVVALAFIVFYITSLFGKGAITMPWRMLAIGFMLFTIADLYYSYYSWIGTYNAGDPIEIAWNLGYMALALGSLYQRKLIESLNQK